MRILLVAVSVGLLIAQQAPVPAPSPRVETIKPVPKGFTWNDLDIGGPGNASALRIESNGNVYLHGKLVGKLTDSERKVMQEALRPVPCPECKFCPATPDYAIRSLEARI
jgi:hypothetical protein